MPKRQLNSFSHLDVGADIGFDAMEFGAAMDAWKRRHHIAPTCRDVLAVAKSLGYRLPETTAAALASAAGRAVLIEQAK